MNNSIPKIEMVPVHGGNFTMGYNGNLARKADVSSPIPEHQVTVDSFSIGKYPVTQKQWKAIMGTNPSYFNGDDLPVEQVSWDDVQEFIKKLNEQTGKNYRLPTEAEWEYAARGGNKSKGFQFSGTDNFNEDDFWHENNSGKRSQPVGKKRPNELGIYDMSGNVCEWCNDWVGKYSAETQFNPTGPTNPERYSEGRIVRGGSWHDHMYWGFVWHRYAWGAEQRLIYVGFRLVLPYITQLTNTGNSEKNGCYIATACYGSYDCEQVLMFRHFRDEYLSQTIAGRMFIKTYYVLSPSIAQWLKNQRRINTFIRENLLDPIYNFLKEKY